MNASIINWRRISVFSSVTKILQYNFYYKIASVQIYINFTKNNLINIQVKIRYLFSEQYNAINIHDFSLFMWYLFPISDFIFQLSIPIATKLKTAKFFSSISLHTRYRPLIGIHTKNYVQRASRESLDQAKRRKALSKHGGFRSRQMSHANVSLLESIQRRKCMRP